MVNLLKVPVIQIYNAKYLSISFVVSLFTIILTFVLSYLLANYSSKFFIKYSNQIESPYIDYNNQYILEVTDINDTTYYYSSIIRFNDFYPKLLNVPYSTLNLVDVNKDNIDDAFRLNIKVLFNSKSVKNVKLGFFYKYNFMHDYNEISHDAFNYIDIDTPFGVSKINMDGYIEYDQKSPVYYNTLGVNIQNSLIANTTYPRYINEIKSIYLEQNYTTFYNYDIEDTYNIMPFVSSEFIDIDLVVRVPYIQNILFESPYLYILKLAWIQYLSLLVPIGILFYIILYYLYTMNILHTIRVESNMNELTTNNSNTILKQKIE